jgi:hypothetical protein
LNLIFSGCSQRKEVVIQYETKYVCTKQSIFTKPKLHTFLAEEDKEKAIEYEELNNLAYKNYEKQVKENNRICDKYNKKVK